VSSRALNMVSLACPVERLLLSSCLGKTLFDSAVAVRIRYGIVISFFGPVAALELFRGRKVRSRRAGKRDRTTTALTAIQGQRKGREALSAQRQRESSTLADLKAEHAALAAKGR
jgi:hypothetical protein